MTPPGGVNLASSPGGGKLESSFVCRSQPVILTEVVTTHKFLQLDGLGPWWAYGTYSHQGPSCGVLVVMGISQCLQFWWACTHRQVLRGILHNQCSCTHTLDPDSSMTAFDPGMSLNCLHSHFAMVPVSAAHVIWQALAAYAVAGPCLTQACRELPAPVPQGCGVVVGDLQFMYIATLVALTAGTVVPFSLHCISHCAWCSFFAWRALPWAEIL